MSIEKLLFVCSGNVARSQIAAELFKKYNLDDSIKVYSAGLDVKNPGQKINEINKQFYSPIEVIMKRENIDFSNNYRRQLTKEIYNNSDKVIILIEESERKEIPKYCLNNEKTLIWNIENPKGKSKNYLIEIVDSIKKELYELFRKENIESKIT